MTNIRTVSKLAGVSVATVSTFSKPDTVSESAREKVEAAAKAVGYRPNSLARNLRSKRSHTIVVLVPNIANPFFSRVIQGIEAAAQKSNYSILLGNTNNDIEREADYANMVLTAQADGVIQLSARDPFAELPAESRPPLVNVCECYEAAFSPKIQLDNAGAASAMVEHLIALGHQQLGIIKGPSNSPLTRERLAGCQTAMERAGLEIRPNAIIEGDFTSLSGFRNIDALLCLRKRPTAIFCFNDEMAIGAIRRIRDLGYSVPGDISVAGFDDIALSSYCDPTLTTIKQPAETFGEKAVKTLCEIIDGALAPQSHTKLILPYELVIRGSTAPVRGI